MVQELLRKGYIKRDNILNAFRTVDRANFVPDKYKEMAYYDEPIPIGYKQTTSAPSMIAVMLHLLEPNENSKVLEIGTGCGYNACLLGALGKEVITIERIPELKNFAMENMKHCPYRDKIKIILGDGSNGYQNNAPYDRILVTCGAPDIPQPILGQLKEGGIMVIPVGGTFFQELYVVEKKEKYIKKTVWGDVSFVPMIGKHGHRLA